MLGLLCIVTFLLALVAMFFAWQAYTAEKKPKDSVAENRKNDSRRP